MCVCVCSHFNFYFSVILRCLPYFLIALKLRSFNEFINLQGILLLPRKSFFNSFSFFSNMSVFHLNSDSALTPLRWEISNVLKRTRFDASPLNVILFVLCPSDKPRLPFFLSWSIQSGRWSFYFVVKLKLERGRKQDGEVRDFLCVIVSNLCKISLFRELLFVTKSIIAISKVLYKQACVFAKLMFHVSDYQTFHKGFRISFWKYSRVLFFSLYVWFSSHILKCCLVNFIFAFYWCWNLPLTKNARMRTSSDEQLLFWKSGTFEIQLLWNKDAPNVTSWRTL